MAKPNNNRYKQRPGGGGRRIATVVLLAAVLLAIGLYYLVPRKGNAPVTPSRPLPHAENASPMPKPEAARPAQPVVPPQEAPGKGGAQYPHETVTVDEEKEPAEGGGGAKGRLAIIIDDMGSTVQEARTLAGIGLPLTFSIIPGLRSDRDVADFAARSGIDTMIHMPMQSKGWPQRRLEANGLLVSMDDAALREHLDDYTSRIPTAIGVNNHMGSEFTEHDDKMKVVLEVLKGKGLFFIDSVTTPRTVGARLAREMGVKTAKRNVFLDNEQNSAYIRGQLAQAVRMARKNGTAIAICHPHPATIATLTEALPTLAGQGITLVPVSQLVR